MAIWHLSVSCCISSRSDNHSAEMQGTNWPSCDFTKSISPIRTIAEYSLLGRIVIELYTDKDPRPSRERPRAVAVLLSFWHCFLRQRIEDLRSIFFHTTVEDTMEIKIPEIYACMGRQMWQGLEIRRDGGEPGEQDAFNKTLNETKFGRCARHMERHNQAMKDAGIEVTKFEFLPWEEGWYGSFVIEFGVAPSHRRQGHRTSHRRSGPRRH